MTILDTYFRKEDLSIMSPFVSQSKEKEIGPVATSKKFTLFIWKREKVNVIFKTNFETLTHQF